MKNKIQGIGKYLIILFIAGILPATVNGVVPVTHPGLKVAMVQMDVIDGNLEENMGRAEKSIREAAMKNADMVCLPEAADFGWLCQSARKDACPIPGKYTDFLCKLSKELRIWICAGCLERSGDMTYNSAVLIDRTGKIILKHRKINTLSELTSHLYDAGSPDDIRVADTEFGRLGITICADNFTIEYPVRVASQGAWLLITPHGFAEKQKDLVNNGVAFIDHIRKVAKETRLWVIATDTGLSRVAGGDWKGYLHSGFSTIADPSGKVIALGRFKEPDIIFCEIPAENDTSLR